MQNVQTRVAQVNACFTARNTNLHQNVGKSRKSTEQSKLWQDNWKYCQQRFWKSFSFHFCSFSSDLFGQQQSVLSTFEINKRTFKSPETLLGLFWALCRQTAFPHDRLKPLNLPSVCKHWRPKLRSSLPSATHIYPVSLHMSRASAHIK